MNRPLVLRHATLPNRLAKASMSERLGDARGAPTEALVRLYRRWARGGAGALLTGNVMVDRAHIAEAGNAVVDDDRDLAALRAWAAAARSGGGVAIAQINHPGRQTPRFVDPAPVAPSAVPMKLARGAFAAPRALTDAEIRAIVDRFAATAAVLTSAGFDGVEVHAAHGYLASQFLSPRTNLRDDAWGGDPDRRRRFLVEVVRAVRASVGSAVVAVKLNSADFQRGGFDEDESLRVVEALQAEGIDLLEVSGGTYEKAAMFAETSVREAFFLDYAEKVRERVRVPLMVTGGFRSRAGMQAALDAGSLDVVGLARPLAVEPDLPRALLAGEADAARTVSLRTGWRSFDDMVQGGWYQAQIQRMADGRDPDVDLGRVCAALHWLRHGPERVAA